MIQAPEPDPEAICALIVDDVIDLLRRGQAKSTVLLGCQEKWMQAGASLETCKVVRLLVASLGANRQGQATGPPGEMLANWIRSAMEELASGDWDNAGDLPQSSAVGAANSSMALIMKGGGIKGLAYVGAIDLLAERYRFNWFVGTSAGAVTAVLLGAGYTSDELKAILRDKDFRDFFDASGFGKWINLAFYRGLYPANSLTTWLDKLLAEKLRKPTRVMLSDLPWRVTVYASQRDKRALKFDSFDNDVAAAYAVRCSMSIPFVFIPQADQGLRAYDGGLQHNYPVDDLLASHPGTSFISLYLGSEVYEPIQQRGITRDLISIWTESADAEALSRYRDRTVIIDPRPVGTLDFALTNTEKEFLLASGRAGALAHLSDNSEDHQEAKRLRDDLKTSVENSRKETRRIRRSHRRAKLYLAVSSVFFLMASIFLYSLIFRKNP